jgi:hypothetical protein
MSRTNSLTSIGNGFIKSILRSPFHKIWSGNTLVLFITGRASGKTIATPVNYARQGPNLYMTSLRERHWWRNLRGGAPVQVRLGGKKPEGWAEVLERQELVQGHLATYFNLRPKSARYFHFDIQPSGQPDLVQLERAAKDRVGICLTLKGRCNSCQ